MILCYFKSMFKNLTESQIYKINHFKEMIRKYHDELHLVSNNALDNLDEHIKDSLFLWKFIKDEPTIIDVGSGNGLPGIILGILGATGCLVDSNKKKAAFLETLVSDLKLNLKVMPCSIKQLSNMDEKWIIARGFASLDKCLKFTENLWEGKKGLFFKSEAVEDEIKHALTKKGWKFNYTIHNRYMRGTIVEIENVKT